MTSAFKKFDKLLLIGVLFLLLIGVWMMSWVSVFNSNEKEHYSAARSYCVSQIPNYANVTKETQKKKMLACIKTSDAQEASEFFCSINNCNDRYFNLHMRNIAIGLFGMFIAFLIPIVIWRKTALLIFVVGFILLIVVLVIPAQGGFTAKSWLPIPILGLFQPSEAMKLGLAFYAALWISKKQSTISTFKGGFLPYLILVSLAVGPVMSQPDYGSSIILMAIASSMFFIGGASILHMGISLGLALGMGIMAYYSFDYIKSRFDTFFNPESVDTDASYQIDQAHISLGNGGLTGSLNTTESFGFLPEIQGDMIFAATGEYWGFLGMIILIGIYIFITIRGINIARNAKNQFSKLLASGIISWFASQTVINMMVVTGLFPLTGITLPLLSYGGTSMLITLIAIGILLRISASVHENENEAIVNRRRKRRTFVPTSYAGTRSLR
ncbi:TPA: cell division protein FtsW [Candidatus Peregrinibacteria bacterium]|nr:cell division protein FtsW [Candidatus Peregrinibacteria bacterium]HIQ57187.1 cell division protein FtsW [Candidatus Gracilibacteria bacterium]